MISYYVRNELNGRVDAASRPPESGSVWVHGSEVTTDEVSQLVERYGLDTNIVRDVFDRNELPRIEFDEYKNMYVFLRVAWRAKSKEIKTAPLLAVVSKKNYLTLSQTNIQAPGYIEEDGLDKSSTSSIAPLLYTFAGVVSDYEQLVHATTESVRSIKYRLRSHEATNDDFLRFITIEENLAVFLYNLTAMFSVAERLLEDRRGRLTVDDMEALEDIMLQLKQLKANVGYSVSAVASIQNVYSTVSNNTLNQRMKFLTIITLLVTVPNVFYGMYGMNVTLPFAHHPWAYGIIVGFTFIMMAAVLVLVRKSRLL